MIITSRGSNLLLITQPDHAQLAGRMMSCWRSGGLPSSTRRSEILLATHEHDNGWTEPDAAPRVDPESGRIVDFITAPAEIRQGVWARGIGRLAHVPYAAALVAHHAAHVYSRFRPDPGWQRFFDEMHSLEEAHRAQSGVDDADLLQEYQFVRLGDLISLLFCGGLADDEVREGRYTIRRTGIDVTVAPDPFEGETVVLDVIARELPDRRFSSTADLIAALANAPTVHVAGTLSGMPLRA